MVVSAFAGIATARAETLLVLPASGQNVSPHLVDQARATVVERLALICRGCRILDRLGAPTTIPMRPVAAIELGRTLGAHATVALNIAHDPTAVPPSTVVTLTAYAFAPSRFPLNVPVQVYRSTTAGPEVLSALSNDLVLSLFGASGAAPTQEWAAPIPPATAVRKAPRTIFVGGDAGFNVVLDTPAEAAVTIPRIGLFAMHVRPTLLADVRGEIGSDGPARVLMSAGLGAYLRQGERWFAGATARWARQEIGGRSAHGAMIQPVVGMLYVLGSWPIVRLDVGYAINLFREREKDRLIPGSGAAHRAHGPTFTLGIAF